MWKHVWPVHWSDWLCVGALCACAMLLLASVIAAIIQGYSVGHVFAIWAVRIALAAGVAGVFLTAWNAWRLARGVGSAAELVWPIALVCGTLVPMLGVLAAGFVLGLP